MNSRNKLDRYFRIKSPDKEALADLVVKAKGPNRSMRQFAEELGVNASTLSRIINKKTASSNSDDLIADIADHADPDSNVTFERLMEAHGMALKDKASGNIWATYNESASDTIVCELTRRHYKVQRTMRWDSPIFLGSVLGNCYLDMEVHTDALGKSDSAWLFDFFAPGSGGVKNKEQEIDRIRQWMLMYAGMMAFNTGRADRLSVVLSERDVYDEVIRHCEGYSLPFEMSVILIDLERTVIIEEYVLNDKPYDNPVFFTLDADEESDDFEITDFEKAVVFGKEFLFQEYPDDDSDEEDDE